MTSSTKFCFSQFMTGN
ncbi:peptide IlvX [Enterobacter roggenkampii]